MELNTPPEMFFFPPKKRKSVHDFFQTLVRYSGATVFIINPLRDFENAMAQIHFISILINHDDVNCWYHLRGN